MKKILILLFVLCNHCGFSQNQTAKSEVKELPAYDFVSSFVNGYAYVQSINKDSITFGFIDKTGQEVIPCRQRTVYSHTYVYGGFFGDAYNSFINKKGLTVLKKDGQAFLYDVRQKKFLGEGYNEIVTSMSHNDFVAHKNDSTSTLLNDSGKFMFEVKTKNISRVNKNRYVYLDSSNQWCIVDSDNKLIKKFAYRQYRGITVLSENRLSFVDQDSCGLLDPDGNVVMQPKYNHIYEFNDGYAIARLYGKNNNEQEKQYLINENGNPLIIKDSSIVIDPMATYSLEGSVRVVFDLGGGYTAGLMDNNGNLVVKPVFNTIYNFREGIAPFQSTGYYGCIDKTGKLLFRTNGLAFFREGVAVIQHTETVSSEEGSERYEVIDKQGKMIMQTKSVKRK
jgi:hypothetical protein